MGKVAIIVDGGYLRTMFLRNKITVDSNTVYQKIMQLYKNYFALDELYRIFYYDCIPDPTNNRKYKNPVDQSEVQLLDGINSTENIKLFSELKQKSFLAFRYGELSYNGWVLKNPIKFAEKISAGGTLEAKDYCLKVTQKSVDLKMGLDIAWLSTKRIVDKLLIIAEDSDLVPAMKFARKEGLNVYLATLGNGVKSSMIEHSDFVIKNK